MYYVLVAVGLAVIFYVAFILPAQWVKVVKVQLPLGLHKRMLQISDLHVERLRVSPARLTRIIQELKPDYIFLTGDYTQRVRYLGKVKSYLQAVADTQIPAFAVLGNHDYRLRGNLQQLLHLFELYGIPVLRNESIRLDGFHLVGIDDDSSGKSDPEKALRGIRVEETSVVMTHDPNVTLRIRRPYSYLMCGHFHGRQFRIPYFFRVFKNKGPLATQGIYQGLHRDEHGAFYISKGIGQAGVNLRFLIRSELTVHEL